MQPEQLSHEDLAALVETIRDTLWPPHDPHRSWSPDTLDTIARIMDDAGLSIGPLGGNDAAARGGR